VIKTRPACLSSKERETTGLFQRLCCGQMTSLHISHHQLSPRRNVTKLRQDKGQNPAASGQTTKHSQPTPRLAVQRHRHLRRPRRHTLSIVFVACHCLWRVGVAIQWPVPRQCQSRPVNASVLSVLSVHLSRLALATGTRKPSISQSTGCLMVDIYSMFRQGYFWESPFLLDSARTCYISSTILQGAQQCLI
jgi:hypothetical protein